LLKTEIRAISVSFFGGIASRCHRLSLTRTNWVKLEFSLGEGKAILAQPSTFWQC